MRTLRVQWSPPALSPRKFSTRNRPDQPRGVEAIDRRVIGQYNVFVPPAGRTKPALIAVSEAAGEAVLDFHDRRARADPIGPGEPGSRDDVCLLVAHYRP